MLTSLRKSDLLVLITAAVALTMVGVSSRVAITSDFDELDRRFLRAESARLEQAIKGHYSSLQSKLEDWATWDETYQYIANDAANFEQINVTPAALTALRINGAIFLNDDLSTKSAFLKRSDSEIIERHSEVRLEELGVNANAVLAASTASHSSLAIFVGKPALAVTRGVLKGDGTGPVRGRIVFLRTFDESLLQTISDQTLHKVQLEGSDWKGSASGSGVYIPDTHGRILIEDDSAVIEHTLATHEGKRLGTLTMAVDREIMTNGRATVHRFTLIFVSISLGALFASALAMPYFRTSRALRKLSADHKTLAGRENQLRALFDSVPGLVVWFDAKLKILGSNEAFLAGRNGELKHDRLSDRDPLESHVIEASREIFAERCSSSESIFEMPDERRLLIRARLVQNSRAIVAIATDITAAWQAQQEVIRNREILVQAIRQSSIANLAAGVAHEINNPLAIIMGKSEKIVRLLSKDTKNIDAKALLREIEIMQQASSRVAKIAWSLADISRDTSNDLLETVSVEELINTSLMSCSARIASENVSLTLRGESTMAFVQCQKTPLVQSFLSLISNALDAVADAKEKWIVIACERHDDVFRISFTDSGTGIAKEHRAKIMQPFFSTKQAGKGAGLSLSVAKKFVETSGGILRLDESAANTTFVIELKRATIGLTKAS